MELLVVSLGGEVPNFSFKLPGPDHHARWMSKGIYFLKLNLLKNVFKMSEEEKDKVSRIAEFIILFYAKLWFTSPLAASAARYDLEFMSGITDYRLVDPSLSFHVLKSCYRHLWYLVSELIPLVLVDSGLEDFEREKVAKAIYAQERKEIKPGKPAFPVLEFGAKEVRKDLSVLVGPESWLVFDILGLSGPQDWLLADPSTWDLYPEYEQLQIFTRNLVVVNDLAERGIHLATDYINRVESAEQREALFQVVEDFRGKVKNLNKKSLENC